MRDRTGQVWDVGSGGVMLVLEASRVARVMGGPDCHDHPCVNLLTGERRLLVEVSSVPIERWPTTLKGDVRRLA